MPRSADTGSFDCVAVRFASGNFAQDDNVKVVEVSDGY
jgi:hypothetical protein